jgi:hypothetical protein
MVKRLMKNMNANPPCFLRSVALVFFALLGATAHAEGSVGFQEDIVPILKTKPVFMKFILDTFQIKHRGNGWGIRIGNEAMPHLGGVRIGPYTFDATWHGPDGDTPITLVVNTNTKFFNRAGREIIDDSLAQAYSIKEALESIEVIEPDRGSSYSSTMNFDLPDAPTHSAVNVSFQNDILPTLEDRPVFKKFILGTFKISDVGQGVRSDSKATPHLGSVKIGPYRFHAIWHGPTGDTPLTLIVNTNHSFFNRNGQKITIMMNAPLSGAYSSREMFDSIEIDPVQINTTHSQ